MRERENDHHRAYIHRSYHGRSELSNNKPQLGAPTQGQERIKRVKNISVLNFILCVFLEATKQARNRNRIRKKDQRTNERTGRQTDRQPDRQMERRTDRQQAKLVLLLKEKKFAWKERERERKKRLPMAGRVRKVSYLWDSLFFLRKLSKLEPVVKKQKS